MGHCVPSKPPVPGVEAKCLSAPRRRPPSATAHMADHSMGAAIYVIKALTAAGQPVEEEKQWQLNHLPESLRTEMLSALELRLGAWL